jgi:predicted transcriptional regulator
MSNKELVFETLRKLPEDVTLDEISEEIATLAAIRRGEEAADAGQVVPHDEVKKRFDSWTSK